MRLTAPLLAATMMAGLSACASTPQPMASAPAAVEQAAPDGPPDLLVVIAVDQLSSRLMEEYLPLMSGGLKRIAGQGTYFVNGYQAQAATETCPGHSTILTGSLPARTGIIANEWVEMARGEGSEVYCAEDPDRRGEQGDRDVISARHLLVPTLGTYMKAADARSRNVAIAGKDRAAVMLGGHDADQRWWWGPDGWMTDLAPPAPDVVTSATVTTRNLIDAGSAGLTIPTVCAEKPVVTVGDMGPMGRDPLGWEAGDGRKFRRTPAYDGAVLALGGALIDDLKLGRGEAPDLISLGLSATDYVGHAYGPLGGEMCLQMFALDQNLDGFLKFLDGRGLDYAVVLTADHGGQPIPERYRLTGVDAERIDAELVARVNKSVGDRLGLAEGWVEYGAPGDVYVDPGLDPKIRDVAKGWLKMAYEAEPQVEAVWHREEIMMEPIPTGDPTGWTLKQRVRASFHPDRSGDLYVVIKEYVTPIAEPMPGYVSTHGSPYEYDRRVPVAFYRPGAPALARPDAVRTVDILPTLAAHLGLSLGDAELDGVCLDGVHAVRCAR
ncbi:alkaline phosphatase family protein [Sphingomicrobium astaxanthinifaciens]|uniref:alkaline phosphatase family protein n=1 Tax=Sphingomicrobium astaxanthinifaciens TaxID=1227949 RepID=UPI001FCAE7D3|nr:alkaline phosphatase family protein [Sphingomicrobium astaxanthinifaciens]MCJ7420272.1 alkaline phosphatase family protein [Sphingomicrobium astaxanthinifaciens]